MGEAGDKISGGRLWPANGSAENLRKNNKAKAWTAGVAKESQCNALGTTVVVWQEHEISVIK